MTKWTENSSCIRSDTGPASGWASPTERIQWFDQSRVRLKEERGGARKLLEQMKEARDQRQPKGAARKALETSISYFENHLSKMNYARYQKEYLPIGSGVTEAACKTVVKQRLCGSGMKWKQTGVATVIRLRCLILTDGRWQQFWNKISQFGIE